jgi:ubiquinone/menaquinone biosynthesis C-methylase UbiE
MAEKSSYLDMLATLGFAKHIGGKEATDTFIKASKIRPGSKVLDVGCGFGKTSCTIAKEIGCEVMGIDITPKMVQGARQRAKSMGVQDRVTFMIGDARDIPAKTDSFDTVLVESVTIFVNDIDRAINEYHRVVKPGGNVCDNEVCITNNSKEILKDDIEGLESVFSIFSSKTDKGILTFEDWLDTYKGKFKHVDAKHYIYDHNVEMEASVADGSMKLLISQIKSMWLYMTNPEIRKIMDESKRLVYYKDHFGYGLFICSDDKQ